MIFKIKSKKTKKIEQLEKKYKELEIILNANIVSKNEYKNKYENLQKEIDEIVKYHEDKQYKAIEVIDKLRIELKKAKCSRGGFTKKINDLSKENNELREKEKKLNNEIADLKSNRYLVKKIKSSKVPTQKINAIRTIKPSVLKYMAEKHDY